MGRVVTLQGVLERLFYLKGVAYIIQLQGANEGVTVTEYPTEIQLLIEEFEECLALLRASFTMALQP